jgi:hypothetical protein
VFRASHALKNQINGRLAERSAGGPEVEAAKAASSS